MARQRLGHVRKKRSRQHHALILGSHLRRLRERAGFSEEVVARKVGCSQQYISRIEQGLVNLPIETLLQLALALEIPLVEIVIALDQHCLRPHLHGILAL